MSLTLSIHSAVSLHDGRPVTTSLKVAEFFDKNHKDVLRDIRKMIDTGDNPNAGPFAACKSGLSMSFSRRNFAPRDYKDERGRVWEMFEMTFNGFVMLVMGYTGPKAMAIKEAYVAEFDRMRAELESIKADALGRAHDQLEGRNPDWPLIRKEYLRVSGTGREIEERHGFGRGKVSRNVRRMIAWGYMNEKDVRLYQALHREFSAALRQVKAEQQLKLKLD